MNQVQELEQAILGRAQQLAAEIHRQAERSRDSILREGSERLRLRESREETIARSLGERTYRQRVQASELKMQSHLDRLRWSLVQAIERRLKDRMHTFINDENTYDGWLQSLVISAAAIIESPEILVRANPADHKRLTAAWDAISATLPEGRTIRLCDDPIDTLAGCLIQSTNGRIRVDQTFEGRLDRLRKRVQQVILERLLPGGLDNANLFAG